LLKEGTTRQYIRGHKSNPPQPVDADGFSESPVEDVRDFLTLEEAAAATPDDAEPKDQPEFKPKTVVKVTAAVRRDVEGKLAFAIGLTGQLIMMADPICGQAYLENGDNIARKLTPLMCQSPEVVRWFTKSGTFILWVDFMVALWPVLTVVFAHHVAKTAGANVSPNGQGESAASQYVVT